MEWKCKFIFVGFMTLGIHSVLAQEIWSIGPMLHINFGGEKRTTSFAIEAAYWNIDRFPYSVDFAIEFDRGAVRLYSEAQTGIGLAGVSVGPVIEFARNPGGVRLGMQGTVWANYFLGVDYRLRFIRGNRFHCLGFYGKLPIATSGFATGSSSSSWGGWDSWD